MNISLTCISYEVSYVFAIILSVYLLCPNRYKLPKMIIGLPIGAVSYIVMNQFATSDNAVCMILAAVMELLFTFTLVLVCTRGNIWSNYLICLINVYMTTIVTSIIGVIYKPLGNQMALILEFKECDWIFAIAIDVLVITAAILCTYFNRKICRGITRLTNRQARTVVITVFAIIMSDYLLKQSIVVKKSIALPKGSTGDVFYVVLSLLLSGIICALFFFVPTIIINNTIKKENKNRELYLKKQGDYYNRIIESNSELRKIKEEFDETIGKLSQSNTLSETDKENINRLKEKVKNVYMQPLSGDIVIDAIFAEYYKKAEQNNVLLESSIEPLMNANCKYELVGILNELLERSLDFATRSSERSWIKVIIREKSGMVAIEVAFSKEKKKLRDNDKYRFIETKNYLDEVSGSILVKDVGTEGCVSILIPAF